MRLLNLRWFISIVAGAFGAPVAFRALLKGILVVLLTSGNVASSHYQGKVGKRPVAEPDKALACLKIVCPKATPENNLALLRKELLAVVKKNATLGRVSPIVEGTFKTSGSSFKRGYQDWLKSLLDSPPDLNKSVDPKLYPYANLQLLFEFQSNLALAYEKGKFGEMTEKEHARFLVKVVTESFPKFSEAEHVHVLQLYTEMEGKDYHAELYDEDPSRPFKAKHPRLSLGAAIKSETEKALTLLKEVEKQYPELVEAMPQYAALLSGEMPIIQRALKGDELPAARLSDLNWHLFSIRVLHDLYMNKGKNAKFYKEPPKLAKMYPKAKELWEKVQKALNAKKFDDALSEKAKKCADTLVDILLTLPSKEQIEEAKKSAKKAKEGVRAKWVAKTSRVSMPILDKRLNQRSYKMPPNPKEFEESFLATLNDNKAFAVAFNKAYERVRKKKFTKEFDKVGLYFKSSLSTEYILEQAIALGCTETRGYIWAGSKLHDHFDPTTVQSTMSIGASRNPKIALMVAAHEYGHAVDPLFFPEELRKKLSAKTIDKTKKAKDCLESQHGEKNAKIHREEDFADLISAHVTPVGKENLECSFLPAEIYGKDAKSHLAKAVFPAAGWGHSSPLFRVLHLEHITKGKVPDVCVEFLKAIGAPATFKKCL